MKKFNLKTILFFILIYFSSLTMVSAWNPTPEVSEMNICEYKVVKKSVNWTSSTSVDWDTVQCNWNIDMSSYTDWVYNLYFRSEDNTVNNGPNKMSEIYKGTYKIDKTAPNCELDSIELHWIDNQYYVDWKLYYKQANNASWTFLLNITCTETNYLGVTCDGGPCVSWIKEIFYPTILWATKNIVKNNWDWVSEKKELTLEYSWSWNYSDSFDILNYTNDFIEDNAWNKSKLKSWSNTKVKFCSSNWSCDTSREIDNINSLTLIPDWDAPTFDSDFKYVSWNEWSSTELDIIGNDLYIAAFDFRKIKVPTITDNGSWVRSFNVNIEKYNNKNLKKSNPFAWWTLNNSQVTQILSSYITHNFSRVSFVNSIVNSIWDHNDYESAWYRNYSWELITKKDIWIDEEWVICDMVNNCTAVSTPDFKVVANTPDTWKTLKNDGIFNNSNILSNYSDKHNFNIKLRDEYDNEVVAVDWVKTLDITTKFTNSLWVNQVTDPEKWDWVKFTFKDLNSNNVSALNEANQYKEFSWTITKRLDLDEWELNINIVSAVPTKEEYKTASNNPGWSLENLYWDLTAKLNFDSFDIKVNNLHANPWLWEFDNAASDFLLNLADFKFNPVISFDYIDNIFPLVEWQDRTLKLKSIEDNSSNFNLDIQLWTNNQFLEFTPEEFDIDTYSNDKNYSITFKPKTTSWITASETNVALYSTLTYSIAWKYITLPWIQTWFDKYWVHNDTHFNDTHFNGNSYYDGNSSIAFSELQISWISQTNNYSNTSDDWTWSNTTDNSTTKFEDFSKITLFDLKTDIHKNVVNLKKWQNLTEASLSSKDDIISDFDNFYNNWLVLKLWDVLYVKNRDIIINCANNSCAIDGKKTIIIENGNLTINSDMYYSNFNSILWIILIWNSSSWNKSQLKINENITNWVWIVYSEWPIVSINDSWTIYNWNNVWSNLVNQLHWKGSFITRNTVWWSINFNSQTSCPYGTPDYEKDCTQKKAQAYDLIYLRRYVRVNKQSNYWTIYNPMWDNKVPLYYNTKDIKISGWRIIYKEWDMDSWDWNLIKSNNYNAPLIIDYDSKIQSNPPYGFE